MSRKNKILIARALREASEHYVTVEVPPAHQGVGQALRSVYQPLMDLPADIVMLLERLDRS